MLSSRVNNMIMLLTLSSTPDVIIDHLKMRLIPIISRGRRGRMLVGFATTYAISAYHH